MGFWALVAHGAVLGAASVLVVVCVCCCCFKVEPSVHCPAQRALPASTVHLPCPNSSRPLCSLLHRVAAAADHVRPVRSGLRELLLWSRNQGSRNTHAAKSVRASQAQKACLLAIDMLLGALTLDRRLRVCIVFLRCFQARWPGRGAVGSVWGRQRQGYSARKCGMGVWLGGFLLPAVLGLLSGSLRRRETDVGPVGWLRCLVIRPRGSPLL